MTGPSTPGSGRPDEERPGPAQDRAQDHAQSPGSAGASLPGSGPHALPFSVLLAAPRALGPTAAPAVTSILVTTAVQAVLMYLDVQSGLSLAFVASAGVSVLVTLALYGVLTACALESADDWWQRRRQPAAQRAAVHGAALPGASVTRTEPGASPLAATSTVPATPIERASGRPRGAVARRVRAHAGLFVAWVALQWLAILLVSVVSPWLIAAVAVLTPFLPLAALDGHRDALLVNLRVVRQRFGRWLVTSLVLLLLAVVLFVLSVANTLFVQGTPAAILFWSAIGLVAWWVLTAWALIYRGSPDGSRPE